jgi:hypothetical protein
MIRVGWLHDVPPFIGGAELTERELRAHAPDGVELVDCPPGGVETCDRYAIHNCITYSLDDIRAAVRRPAVKYWNDVGSWYDEAVRRLLDRRATPICCSPLQADYMGHPAARLIPPAVDLDRFERAAAAGEDERAGAVSVGSWRNRGKGAHATRAWGEQHGGVDFYGGGVFAPPDARPIAYEGVPALLARYRTFVHLPDVIEPFGRGVAEAWAAGCELIVNGLVGAAWWITENREALRTAGEDFWAAVLGES